MYKGNAVWCFHVWNSALLLCAVTYSTAYSNQQSITDRHTTKQDNVTLLNTVYVVKLWTSQNNWQLPESRSFQGHCLKTLGHVCSAHIQWRPTSAEHVTTKLLSTSSVQLYVALKVQSLAWMSQQSQHGKKIGLLAHDSHLLSQRMTSAAWRWEQQLVLIHTATSSLRPATWLA
jgi:hypothetical protein